MNEVMQRLAKYLEQKIKIELLQQQHNASGGLYKSIHVDVVSAGESIGIIGYQDSIGKFVDSGRRKGAAKVPIFALEQWIRTKGIATDDKEVKGIAFAIQKSIERKGIPSKPYKVWTQGNSLKRTGFLTDTLDKEIDHVKSEINTAMRTNINLLLENIARKFNTAV